MPTDDNGNTQRSDQPDLDLIARVQRARLEHDAAARPSAVSAVYWIEVKRGAEHGGPAPTARAGQWVLHTTVAAVDALWAQVKAATERGQLGYKAKVSTASRGGASAPDDRMICVLTYDADDAADTARVRAVLTEIGADGAWTYARVRG
ncbi:MAG: DUF1917 domain-containing protein [Chloroflexi bacterium]|nr:DUF1917 domain-containing protein [Chloroflexota bacterium]